MAENAEWRDLDALTDDTEIADITREKASQILGETFLGRSAQVDAICKALEVAAFKVGVGTYCGYASKDKRRG